MKKYKGSAVIWVVVAVVAVVVLGLATYLVVDANNRAAEKQAFYDSLDTTVAIESNEANGNIGDHIKGNPDAPLVIVEYANFECSHCASMNPMVERLVEDSNGQIAVIFRNMVWSSFPNSKAAAAAAEAAGLQGYWHEYANKLFEDQTEWSSATGAKRDALFEQYFMEVSDNKGDLEKFKSDMNSDAVKQKVDFDTDVAEEVGVAGTPAFYVNGQFIDSSNGGTITLTNGQTVTYEKLENSAAMEKLWQQLLAAQTGQPVVEVTETDTETSE